MILSTWQEGKLVLSEKINSDLSNSVKEEALLQELHNQIIASELWLFGIQFISYMLQTSNISLRYIGTDLYCI